MEPVAFPDASIVSTPAVAAGIGPDKPMIAPDKPRTYVPAGGWGVEVCRSRVPLPLPLLSNHVIVPPALEFRTKSTVMELENGVVVISWASPRPSAPTL